MERLRRRSRSCPPLGGTTGSAVLLDNETNVRRLHGQNDAQGHFKDAFHDYLIAGNKAAVNPRQTETKAAAHFVMSVPAEGAVQIKLRLKGATERGLQSASLSEAKKTPIQSTAIQSVAGQSGLKSALQPFADFDKLFTQRRREADEFYAELQGDITDADARLVQRQAFAGMIWSKHFFYYDVPEWIHGDANQPPPPSEHKRGRNHEWSHLNNADIISMPDKWEYPWYAAWDLAFHCVPLAMVDAEFAKSQLVLLTREWYMHPNGQLPA